MWLPDKVIADVEKTANVYYVDSNATARWNRNRRDGELRLLTGWCWVSRNGRAHRQGFKTKTVAYRDAWYELVQQASTPKVSLQLVKRAA